MATNSAAWGRSLIGDGRAKCAAPSSGPRLKHAPRSDERSSAGSSEGCGCAAAGRDPRSSRACADACARAKNRPRSCESRSSARRNASRSVAMTRYSIVTQHWTGVVLHVLAQDRHGPMHGGREGRDQHLSAASIDQRQECPVTTSEEEEADRTQQRASARAEAGIASCDRDEQRRRQGAGADEMMKYVSL
jgi:hypothetical protein